MFDPIIPPTPACGLATHASLHLFRFFAHTGLEDLGAIKPPAGAIAWVVCAEGEAFGAIGYYQSEDAARAAAADPRAALPCLEDAAEAWHAALVPIAHRGQSNHLDKDEPGHVFEPVEKDPGGPLVVVMSVGMKSSSAHPLDALLPSVEGACLTQFLQCPDGPDAMKVSVWSAGQAMDAYAYRPGAHLADTRRHRAAERTATTRLRILSAQGTWNGLDPVAQSCPAIVGAPISSAPSHQV